MRKTGVIARLKTLTAATLGCLLLALVAPMLFGTRAIDEPFTGYSVLASPRDLHVVTKPVRLSAQPDLTLSRGVLYADGNAVLGTPISRFVLDGPVFYLNASGLGATSLGFDSTDVQAEHTALAPLLDEFVAMSFDVLTIRRGTLHVMTAEGAFETISDLHAEISGNRKGQVIGKGSFALRGQQLAFDVTLAPPLDRRARQPWPLKASIKSGLIGAVLDGSLDVTEDLRLLANAELTSTSLRRIARWLGVPVPIAHGLGAATLKGQLTWANRTISIEKAKATIDGNEAVGAISFAYPGERPSVDGTLAFNALDLTQYFEALRSQSYVFDRQTSSWSAFDLSFPILSYIDADLRLSASSVALKGLSLGRAAASISVHSGKLIANVAEIELPTGTASARLSADTTDYVPHYALRSKIDNFDPAHITAVLAGAPLLSGTSALTLDLTATGQTPAEILRSLSGKVALTIAEGGKIGLDVKALRAGGKADTTSGWGMLAKSSTSVETLDLRGHLMEGTAIADHIQARAGTLNVVLKGSADLFDRTLDIRLSAHPAEKAAEASDATAAVFVHGPWTEPEVRYGGPADPVAPAPQ